METLSFIFIGAIIYYFAVARKEHKAELKREGFANTNEKLDHNYQTILRFFEKEKIRAIEQYNLGSNYFETDISMQIDSSPITGLPDFIAKSIALNQAQQKLAKLDEKMNQAQQKIAKQDEMNNIMKELNEMSELLQTIDTNKTEKVKSKIMYSEKSTSSIKNSITNPSNNLNELSRIIDEKLDKVFDDSKETRQNDSLDYSIVSKQTKIHWHDEDSLFASEEPWLVAEEKKSKKSNISISSSPKVIVEKESEYTSYLKSIENLNFEKIRRYCNNLTNDNKADGQQKYLAENGKMYKALMYDALEQFLEKLNGETITLIDWGCGQGIGLMLVLDYIREKQLDIKIDKVFLIDVSLEILSRAMLHVDVLILNDTQVSAVNNDKILGTLEQISTETTLNLIVNDIMPVDIFDIDFELLKNAYFMCLSHKNKEFVDEAYNDITLLSDCQDVSIRDDNIGKFQRFERILKTYRIPNIDINDDEIPF